MHAVRRRTALAVAASRCAVVIAALVLAGTLASTALAQTAGDEQYEDPFGGSATPEATPSPSSGGDETPAPAPSAPAPAAPAGAAAPPAAPASTRPQLPYTGLDAGLVALAGASLLGGGVILRARLRERA
jgi:hypothetical protein